MIFLGIVGQKFDFSSEADIAEDPIKEIKSFWEYMKDGWELFLSIEDKIGYSLILIYTFKDSKQFSSLFNGF